MAIVAILGLLVLALLILSILTPASGTR